MAIQTIRKKWGTVRQAVVDREYVLEEKVENYVPEPEAEEKGEKGKDADKGKSKVVKETVLPEETGVVVEDDDDDDAEGGWMDVE